MQNSKLFDLGISGHPCLTMFILGSFNTFVNNLPDVRLLDLGVTTHGGISINISGSGKKMVNNIPEHRLSDTNIYLCPPIPPAVGITISGSPNDFVG